MADNKIVGYKKIFGLILPDWVTEKMIKFFAFGVLVTVVMALVLVLVVNPKKDQIRTMTLKVEAEQDVLDALKVSKNGLDKLQNDLSDTEMNAVVSAMPMEYSPERAIFVLRRIAADTGVSIVSYSLPSGVLVDSAGDELKSGGKNMVDFSTYVIKITVSAPVEILLDFIAKLESSLPYGLVSDLNLQEVTKLAKSNQGKNVQISLDIKYFQPRVNAVNINKIDVLNPTDLENARKLSGYNLFVVPEEDSASPESSSSSSLFGI